MPAHPIRPLRTAAANTTGVLLTAECGLVNRIG